MVMDRSVSCSIIIPTKDRPSMLERAVKSALRAVAPDGEVLVVDDHSITPAAEVLKDVEDQRLRIFRREDGNPGVSATRNAGLHQSSGEVILFLDDDDEMLPDYCKRVLMIDKTKADYGFSAYERRKIDGRRILEKRFVDGVIDKTAPVRKKLCGFGMGFWMTRQTFEESGEVDVELSINEDTEYVCRLIEAGKRCWYTSESGVIVHEHSIPGVSDAQHLTQISRPDERAKCMRVVADRYPSMVDHFGAKYVAHLAKSKQLSVALSYSFVQTSVKRKVRFSLIALLKTVASWLR